MNYQITMTGEQLQIVMQCLNNGPHGAVAPIWAAIERQVINQNAMAQGARAAAANEPIAEPNPSAMSGHAAVPASAAT